MTGAGRFNRKKNVAANKAYKGEPLELRGREVLVDVRQKITTSENGTLLEESKSDRRLFSGYFPKTEFEKIERAIRFNKSAIERNYSNRHNITIGWLNGKPNIKVSEEEARPSIFDSLKLTVGMGRSGKTNSDVQDLPSLPPSPEESYGTPSPFSPENIIDIHSNAISVFMGNTKIPISSPFFGKTNSIHEYDGSHTINISGQGSAIASITQDIKEGLRSTLHASILPHDETKEDAFSAYLDKLFEESFVKPHKRKTEHEEKSPDEKKLDLYCRGKLTQLVGELPVNIQDDKTSTVDFFSKFNKKMLNDFFGIDAKTDKETSLAQNEQGVTHYTFPLNGKNFDVVVKGVSDERMRSVKRGSYFCAEPPNGIKIFSAREVSITQTGGDSPPISLIITKNSLAVVEDISQDRLCLSAKKLSYLNDYQGASGKPANFLMPHQSVRLETSMKERGQSTQSDNRYNPDPFWSFGIKNVTAQNPRTPIQFSIPKTERMHALPLKIGTFIHLPFDPSQQITVANRTEQKGSSKER